jgi:lipopolysaccharide/colanic/teichoic acid biosynthesis glycosyltransferase
MNTENNLKTLFDYLATLIILILLIPVILLLSFMIKFSGKGPVIYSQKRVGRNGKRFYIHKFRSMHPGETESIQLISEKYDKRVTSLGRFMRKHKLDEIPNLVNVLKGEMSLIGPRPEQQFYYEQIVNRDPRYKKLLVIKPGITSWGQVKFGYATNVDEMIKRMEFDLYYLENMSMMFDVKIAFYTISVVFRGQGV